MYFFVQSVKFSWLLYKLTMLPLLATVEVHVPLVGNQCFPGSLWSPYYTSCMLLLICCFFIKTAVNLNAELKQFIFFS